MELNKIHSVYFIGIGGIGMSALARFFVAKGISVLGYDKTPSLVTDSLVDLGVDITFDDTESAIREDVINNKNALVVYTPAIPSDNKILNYFKNNSYQLMKRAEVLGIISRNNLCLAIAGTHGKTTTSALLGHIMAECNTGASSFVGGIMSGYNSNLILGDKDVMVVEADEYDRSFLHLSPNIACVTSTDADHLDIYGEAEELENTFVEFTKLLPKDGKLICAQGLNFDGAITYSIDGNSDYIAKNIRVKNGKFIFDIINEKGYKSEGIISNLPGKYNIENTLAAFAMAEQYGLKTRDIVGAIESFEGIKRRFNSFVFDEKIIVDDYAHHPSEVKVALEAAKELFSDKKIAVIFQPHLYSRTRDFENEFAEVLAKFDEVNLLEIYPARELPISGVTSSALLEKINIGNKKLISKEEINSVIKSSSCEVVMMLGAGDISVEINKLKK
jgi:UDP-N-acetylmuramate--alanine ligase